MGGEVFCLNAGVGAKVGILCKKQATSQQTHFFPVLIENINPELIFKCIPLECCLSKAVWYISTAAQIKLELLCFLSVTSPPLALGLRPLQSANRFDSKLSIPALLPTKKPEPPNQTKQPRQLLAVSLPLVAQTLVLVQGNGWDGISAGTAVSKFKLDGVLLRLCS